MEYVIGRRNLLLSAGAVVAAGMTNAALAGAADEPAAPSKGGHQALIDAARECSSTGQACLAHCLAMFKGGDTSLAACAQSVSEMIPACSAVAELATLGAVRLGEFATACRAVCEDCEKECRKHADTHAVCKACADSCARFVNEAKLLSTA
jgi:Cys-rich four helix bundle protein (predicted Tat secretion target)